jgi:chemotaxis protein CheX
MSLQFGLIVFQDDNNSGPIFSKLQELKEFKCIVAQDALEAVQKCRKQVFKIIVCEENTTRLNIKEMVQNIRENKDYDKVPIFFLCENPIKTAGNFFGVKDPYLEFLKNSLTIDEQAKIYFSAVQEGFKPRKKFKLDTHFINPFIECSLNVLKEMVKPTNIKAHKPYLFDPNDQLNIEISGTIDVKSPYFAGTLAISFDSATFLKAMSTMLSSEITEISKSNQDGAAELINIIFGQTKTVLNQNGYEIHKALPSVLRGKNHQINAKTKAPVLIIPIDLDSNRIFIQICILAT